MGAERTERYERAERRQQEVTGPARNERTPDEHGRSRSPRSRRSSRPPRTSSKHASARAARPPPGTAAEHAAAPAHAEVRYDAGPSMPADALSVRLTAFHAQAGPFREALAATSEELERACALDLMGQQAERQASRAMRALRALGGGLEMLTALLETASEEVAETHRLQSLLSTDPASAANASAEKAEVVEAAEAAAAAEVAEVAEAAEAAAAAAATAATSTEKSSEKVAILEAAATTAREAAATAAASNSNGAAAPAASTASAERAELPPGWEVVQRVTPSGRTYLKYRGPDESKLSRSVRGAWEAYERQQRCRAGSDHVAAAPGAPAAAAAAAAAALVAAAAVEVEEKMKEGAAAAAAEGLELVPSPSNATGFRGVYKEDGKYKAEAREDGKKRSLGTFSTPEDAALHYARHIGAARAAAAAADARGEGPQPLTAAEARAAAAAEGLELVPSGNAAGFKGVFKYGDRYEAHVKEDGKTRYLSSFATPEEASLAVARHIRNLVDGWLIPGYRSAAQPRLHVPAPAQAAPRVTRQRQHESLHLWRVPLRAAQQREQEACAAEAPPAAAEPPADGVHLYRRPRGNPPGMGADGQRREWCIHTGQWVDRSEVAYPRPPGVAPKSWHSVRSLGQERGSASSMMWCHRTGRWLLPSTVAPAEPQPATAAAAAAAASASSSAAALPPPPPATTGRASRKRPAAIAFPEPEADIRLAIALSLQTDQREQQRRAREQERLTAQQEHHQHQHQHQHQEEQPEPEEQQQCNICYEDIDMSTVGASARGGHTPCCGNYYHKRCLSQWLHGSGQTGDRAVWAPAQDGMASITKYIEPKCPTCRTDLVARALIPGLCTRVAAEKQKCC